MSKSFDFKGRKIDLDPLISFFNRHMVGSDAKLLDYNIEDDPEDPLGLNISLEFEDEVSQEYVERTQSEMIGVFTDILMQAGISDFSFEPE